MRKYETEAHSRWGNIGAHREHDQKTKNYTKEKLGKVNNTRRVYNGKEQMV